MRNSNVSQGIYRKHIALYRYLNDAWIFTELLRPELEKKAKKLLESKSKAKKSYSVPKKDGTVTSKRRDKDISEIFTAQYLRGIFETNIVSMVSRMEAYVQDCVALVAITYPKKLSILADKNGGIPIDIFLDNESRDDVIRRFVMLRCEGLMFSKPAEYLAKAATVMSIELDEEDINNFLEIKATRDIIIHNSGRINKIYIEKAGKKGRGSDGEVLEIDMKYFKHVLVSLKKLSGAIQSKIEAVYK